jgi:hypothetical protein
MSLPSSLTLFVLQAIRTILMANPASSVALGFATLASGTAAYLHHDGLNFGFKKAPMLALYW